MDEAKVESKFELRLARSLAAIGVLITALAFACFAANFVSRLPEAPLEPFGASLLFPALFFCCIKLIPIWRVQLPTTIMPITSARRSLFSVLLGAIGFWALTMVPSVSVPEFFTLTAGKAVVPLCLLATAIGGMADLAFNHWAQLQSCPQSTVSEDHM